MQQYGRNREPPEQQEGRGRHLSLDEIGADFARREASVARHAAAAGMSRREFLEVLAAGAAAAASASAWPAAARGAEAKTPGTSRVVVVTHPEVVVKEGRLNPPIVRQMLDRALVELTGKRSEAEAWQAIASENDFVAIKHNSIGGALLRTHPEVIEAAGQQLVTQAKVKADRVLAVDRTFQPPYDELSEPFTLPSRGLKTRLRRLYTDQATAIINMPILKAHFGEGLSAALKNHLGSVNNPAAFHGWQPEQMPRSLPELNALEPLRKKTRLVVIDAIRPLYAGGPADNPEYRWDFNGLIVSADPVAASAVGLRILEEKRAAARGKEWPMAAARQMMAYAQSIGLGSADPDRLDVVQVKLG